MERIILEIVLIGALIFINGLFSMTELAVVSARRMRLQGAAEGGSKGAAAAIELQERPERFLSAVQIGITLVGILSGAFGGALLSQEVAAAVATIPMLEPYAPTIGFGLVILVITYFTLVVGELVPKNIALNMPERVAAFFSRPMRFVSKLTAPVVWLLSRSTRMVLGLFRISEASESVMTEEEIKAHIAQGTEIGVFHSSEKELIDSVLRFDDLRATALMTSRVKIEWIDLDDDPEANMRRLAESSYSRLPAGRGTLDELVGVIEKRDVLVQLLENREVDLSVVLREPTFIPETVTALELLGVFKNTASDMAFIVDEFGSIEGLVTLKDVLEEIVGDFPVGGVEHGNVVVREDGSLLIDGSMPVDEFLEAIGIKGHPAGERGMYQTLAGFVLTRLEKLPHEGDHFTWNGRRFEVVDMDGRRVDKVLVSDVPAD
ncbi:MAG: HlyC/CorC family transporter [Acidobacteria bacterium]|nr:HlyC/CorC family transporter [Acidobacteriota bacterium]